MSLGDLRTGGIEDVFELAFRCGLSGGQIRNAALHATLLAVDDGGRVRDDHLLAALQREYRKAGAAYPMRPAGDPRDHTTRLRRLVAELG